MRVDSRCAVGKRLGHRSQRRQILPPDWKACRIESFERTGFAGDRSDGFASKARFSMRKHWLVCEPGDHPVTVFSRYIFRSEHSAYTGMGSHKCVEIVELKPAAALFSNPEHPYTRELLSAVPGRTASSRAA